MTARRPIVEGSVLAPGLATGRLVYNAPDRAGARGARDLAQQDVERELALFDRAVASLVADLRRSARRLEDEGLDDEAEVFAAQIFIVEGAMLRRRVRDLVGPESNPLFGLRAHRLFHFHLELLTTHLRAILRGAAGHRGLRILYPMVGRLGEWHELVRRTRAAVGSLRREDVDFQDRFELGVLVETPAAAVAFRELIADGDFTSVGTNDPVHLLLAVERGNADVARSYRLDHRIVLETLANLARMSRNPGKPLSICGEIAGDPDLAPLLVRLGIDQLSVPIASFGEVYQRLAEVTAAERGDRGPGGRGRFPGLLRSLHAPGLHRLVPAGKAAHLVLLPRRGPRPQRKVHRGAATPAPPALHGPRAPRQDRRRALDPGGPTSLKRGDRTRGADGASLTRPPKAHCKESGRRPSARARVRRRDLPSRTTIAPRR